MCMVNCTISVERLLKGPSKITCYKVLYFINNELQSTVYEKVWKPGWNKSNSKSTQINKNSGKLIYRGIHVFLTKPAKNTGKYRRVVKFTALRSNLIGANNGNLAVFTKVFLSKEEFDKATRVQSVNC